MRFAFDFHVRLNLAGYKNCPSDSSHVNDTSTIIIQQRPRWQRPPPFRQISPDLWSEINYFLLHWSRCHKYSKFIISTLVHTGDVQRNCSMFSNKLQKWISCAAFFIELAENYWTRVLSCHRSRSLHKDIEDTWKIENRCRRSIKRDSILCYLRFFFSVDLKGLRFNSNPFPLLPWSDQIKSKTAAAGVQCFWRQVFFNLFPWPSLRV